jgi:hypothetical protein
MISVVNGDLILSRPFLSLTEVRDKSSEDDISNGMVAGAIISLRPRKPIEAALKKGTVHGGGDHFV